MYKVFFVVILSISLAACQPKSLSVPSDMVVYPTYNEALANWTNYQDVADWLKYNFHFNFNRENWGKSVRQPKNLYRKKSGYCIDAAYFAFQALNRINHAYEASLVFISNSAGGNQHWVTGFYLNDNLYIMDYGAGPNWSAMIGVHGPYQSLDEYKKFLAGLDVPNFRVDSVEWRHLPVFFDYD